MQKYTEMHSKTVVCTQRTCGWQIIPSSTDLYDLKLKECEGTCKNKKMKIYANAPDFPVVILYKILAYIIKRRFVAAGVRRRRMEMD